MVADLLYPFIFQFPIDATVRFPQKLINPFIHLPQVDHLLIQASLQKIPFTNNIKTLLKNSTNKNGNKVNCKFIEKHVGPGYLLMFEQH